MDGRVRRRVRRERKPRLAGRARARDPLRGPTAHEAREVFPLRQLCALGRSWRGGGARPDVIRVGAREVDRRT